ncbi:MAG: hypothetical protein LBM04_08090 [Opitutaceae bacterium]|jgi:TPR repeat protein|nr:hypothetical protein [Opitutaceae bacterium]
MTTIPRLLFLAIALPALAIAQPRHLTGDDLKAARESAAQRLAYASSDTYAPLVPTNRELTALRPLLTTQKKYAEALERIDALLAKNPVSPDLHNVRSMALTRLGRMREASEASRTARALQNATIASITNTSGAGYDTALDAILPSDPAQFAQALNLKIVSQRNETRDGHTYLICAMKWAVNTAHDAETNDYYFNTDRIETARKKNAKPKSNRVKSSGVKVGPATVVADDDSAPKLISTTGGGGGGNGDDNNKWTSFAALKKAAGEQNPDALYELGIAHLEGSTPDTPKNITRALLYLDDAARLGHVAANFRLGKLHADGIETPQNHPKALAYYTVAARAGDPIAQHNVGAMISSGRGVPQRDYPEGLAWLIISARKNSDAAVSEKKLREFLAKRPDWIAAGEKRARELTEELAATPPPKPPAAASKPEIPKLEIAPITSPTITVPPPMPLMAPGIH